MPVTVRHRIGAHVLEENAEAFDRLCARAGAPFTARRRWLQAWVDTHPAWQPELVSLETGRDMVAAAPLARRRRWGRTEIVLLGHGPTDDARLLAEAGFEEQLAAAVTGVLPGGPWRLRLQQVPSNDPVVRALGNRLRHVELGAGQGMPVVRVTRRELSAHLSRNSRKALAKIRNRLTERGLEPEYRWTGDPGEVAGLLPELTRVHRERDLALGRRADHDDPSAAAFYREVVLRHAQAGEVDLLTMRLDGDVAAYVLGFRDGRAFRSWDNRLSPRWAQLSAGRLANTEALRHVVEGEEYDALDWMRGEEPYKLQSATEVVPTAVLTAWSSAGLRRAELRGMSAVGRARALARSHPELRAVRRRLRSLR